MNNNRWQKLQQDFMDLVKLAGGPMKSGCGQVNVNYGNVYDNYGVKVAFGGYCIGDWGRHEEIGPFETEDEAYIAACYKLGEARVEVNKELTE